MSNQIRSEPLPATNPPFPRREDLTSLSSLQIDAALLADGSRIGGECSIQRVVPIHPNGRRNAVKPIEKCQFLEMVGEAVGHFHSRHEGAGQWVAYFIVALAADDLTDVAPGRRGIRTGGIVDPFAVLVRQHRSIGCSLKQRLVAPLEL